MKFKNDFSINWFRESIYFQLFDSLESFVI